MGQNYRLAKPIIQVNENLARPMEDIQPIKCGRGGVKIDHIGPDCICQRPYTHILCVNCGHLMFGRVRYGCPKHRMVTFLIDITNCPKCRAFEFMLEEFAVQDLTDENIQENNNNGIVISNSDGEEDEDL